MKIKTPKFGLNRHDTSSVSAYAADVARAESFGWDAAFLPDSQLRRRDTYVLLYAAAIETQEIVIGPLLTNPVTRHPSVTASSISTVAEHAHARTIIACGIGDTAVRLSGLKPAKINELRDSTILLKSLLTGDPVEIGSGRPSVLPFRQDVPVWLAAGGPRTLEMAGGCADGVFIRVGTNIENIKIAALNINRGAEKSGRDPASVKLGAVFHTVFVEEEDKAMMMGKSMAAGYYEYSPMLLKNLNMHWPGPHPDVIKEEEGIWPDFHHHTKLEESGRAVDFLSPEHARSFALIGDAKSISTQLVEIISEASVLGIDFEYVVLQPIPNPPTPDPGPDSYLERVPKEIISVVKKSIDSGNLDV